MPQEFRKGFDVFAGSEDVVFNRFGKKIFCKGRDATSVDSESVEANLLFEILKVLSKKK